MQYKNNEYRIKTMNAIEALAMRSSASMNDVQSTQSFFTNVLERLEVQVGSQWLPVKQPNTNVYLPDGIENDFEGVKLLVEYFMKEFMEPFFEKSVESQD